MQALINKDDLEELICLAKSDADMKPKTCCSMIRATVLNVQIIHNPAAVNVQLDNPSVEIFLWEPHHFIRQPTFMFKWTHLQNLCQTNLTLHICEFINKSFPVQPEITNTQPLPGINISVQASFCTIVHHRRICYPKGVFIYYMGF